MFLFSTPTPVDDTPPSSETLAKAKSLPLQDAEGNEHLVSSLIGDHQRLLLIFLRHLHCGFCQEYVRACGKNEALKATTTEAKNPLKVVVISHGSYEGINRYKEVSECPFDMYVDSNKNLYTALGLTRRYMGKTAGSKEPAYFQGRSMLGLVASSFQEAIGSGLLAIKGGEIALLGGEFLLENSSLDCTWAHRMRDPADHTEVDELAKKVTGPTPTSSAPTPTSA